MKRGNSRWLRNFCANHKYELCKWWPERNSM